MVGWSGSSFVVVVNRGRQVWKSVLLHRPLVTAVVVMVVVHTAVVVGLPHRLAHQKSTFGSRKFVAPSASTTEVCSVPFILVVVSDMASAVDAVRAAPPLLDSIPE